MEEVGAWARKLESWDNGHFSFGKLSPLRFAPSFFLYPSPVFLLLLTPSSITQVLVPRHQCKHQLLISVTGPSFPAQLGHSQPLLRPFAKEILPVLGLWIQHLPFASGRRQTSHSNRLVDLPSRVVVRPFSSTENQSYSITFSSMVLLVLGGGLSCLHVTLIPDIPSSLESRSGGNRQRVSFLRCWSRRTSALVADSVPPEPPSHTSLAIYRRTSP